METETLNPQVEVGAEGTEVAEPLEGEVLGAEEQEVAETARTEQDSAFAQMRRDNEALARELAEARRQSQEYEDALGLFFDGDDKALQAQAYYTERPIEEIRQNQQMQEQLGNLQSENQTLKEQLMQQQAQAQMDADLAEIQKIDPNIKSINDLGQEYLAFRFSNVGNIGAAQAYQMAKAYKASVTPKKPPVIGDVATAGKPESDYFTREEVEAMSAAEVSKNYSKIRESMGHWKY